jgi:hypothetical protein
MCNRHPAHSGALIEELEQKLAVDAKFIDLVRGKLRVQMFDGHMYHQNEEDMKRQIEEKSLHEHELLTHRQKQTKNFRKYMENEVARPTSESLQAEMKALANRKPRTKRSNTKSRSSMSVGSSNEAALVEKWAAWQAVIHRRTGISDPEAFFKRFTNSADLFKDMTSMKLERDRLKEQNNKAVAKAERDLDNARLEAQTASMHSGEKKKMETRLNSNLRNQIQIKERADKTEKLAQTAVSGLKHICQTLGMPAMDEDTPIQDIINQIETLLDTLLEEKDRVLQKAATNAGQSSTRRETPKNETARATELTAALEQYETPKNLVASRLHGRVVDPKDAPPEDDKPEDDKAKSAKDVKRHAEKMVKAEQRRLAKEAMEKQRLLRELEAS